MYCRSRTVVSNSKQSDAEFPSSIYTSQDVRVLDKSFKNTVSRQLFYVFYLKMSNSTSLSLSYRFFWTTGLRTGPNTRILV
jgi:hypothetical protein